MVEDSLNNQQNSNPPQPIRKEQNDAGEGTRELLAKQEPSSSRKIIKREGRVIEALPNAFFKVLLDDGKEVMGFLSGKMRLNRIKILPGDRVTLEMTIYDEKKGRIVYRLK